MELFSGLAGRKASVGAGNPMNETIYLDIYKTVVTVPLIGARYNLRS